jgi:hypothetical protein
LAEHFCSAFVWFYEVERKRRKIVALVSQMEKCSNKRMVARALFRNAVKAEVKSSGTIRATNCRDLDDRMK